MICWGEKQSAATERNTEKVIKNWVEVHCLILKIANPEQNPPAPSVPCTGKGENRFL